MRFLQSNQFIWDDTSQNYLFGVGVAELVQNSDFLRQSIEDKLGGCQWINNRTVLVASEHDWFCISKIEGTDILQVEDAAIYQTEESQFELVRGALNVDWMFIGDSGKMVCSFSKKLNHPLNQLSEALKRLVKQGLDRSKISEKLTDLDVVEGHGLKSFTYRGVVIEFKYERCKLKHSEGESEIIYFQLNDIQRPFEKFSADFYKVVLNSAAVDIAVFDLDQRYMLINEFAVKNKEIRNWLIGRTDFDYCDFRGIDDSMAKVRQEYFELSKKERRMVEMEEKMIDADGKPRYSLKRFKPIIVQGEIKYMMGFGMDVTPVIEAQEQLQKSLLEKEALLGEIHHRVKNNLTVVYSLLELQAIQEKNADIAFAYRESQSRIKAMALVHEMLYKSHSFEAIELFDYLKNLAEHLQHLLAVDKTVVLKFEGEALELPISKAVTCGLFANEILTNSYKYAIPYVECPEIRIRLEEVEEYVEMEISDNGPGLKEDFEEGKNASLGFKLMRTFASQLKGELTIKSDGGLKYLLKFKK